MGRLKRFKAPKITTVIGSETTIEGNLKFTGGLHVDGVIQGNVLAEEGGRAALILSEKGVVNGDVRVPNIILNGKVVGDVYSSERIELAPNAKVTGTLYYKLLEMAMGAEVNGQLISSEEAVSAQDGSGETQQSSPDSEVEDVGPEKIEIPGSIFNRSNS